jgi:hypothetical protein
MIMGKKLTKLHSRNHHHFYLFRQIHTWSRIVKTPVAIALLVVCIGDLQMMLGPQYSGFQYA